MEGENPARAKGSVAPSAASRKHLGQLQKRLDLADLPLRGFARLEPNILFCCAHSSSFHGSTIVADPLLFMLGTVALQRTCAAGRSGSTQAAQEVRYWRARRDGIEAF
jgi:hypothetical protein